ncbi:MAG: AP2 domain-containing protein [Proteobacteria bacterium]|nr:AP2 domain-containing protein [Pseudomonadota bacterium]
MKKLSALHHISIIESRGTNCAWVRIKYDGKDFQQSFPFKKFGGKNKAIAAAKKKRDIEGKKIYGSHWPYAKFSPRKISPLNSSGEIGVSYSEKDHSWVATWQEGRGVRRKQKNAYFSINKFGENKAKTLAGKARREAVRANRIH